MSKKQTVEREGRAMDEHFKFFTPIQVRYAETDMQGHVFFGNYLTYFDVALTDYVKAIGFGIPDFLAENLDFFYAESLCQYKSRALFDEILHVHARVGHIGRTSFKFEFAVFEENTDRLVCNGHIVAVVVNRENNNPTPVPQGFRVAVENFERAE
jgi:acyl-CoA thioester hydrolase